MVCLSVSLHVVTSIVSLQTLNGGGVKLEDLLDNLLVGNSLVEHGRKEMALLLPQQVYCGCSEM